MKTRQQELTKETRESPTTVKLGDLRPRLHAAAKSLRVGRSAIIRMALVSKLQEIERGVIHMPRGA